MYIEVWTIYEGNKPLGTYRTIGEYNALNACAQELGLNHIPFTWKAYEE